MIGMHVQGIEISADQVCWGNRFLGEGVLVRIRCVFFVPMFSYSAIFESVPPTVFNRQLGGTHTHLFTNESIEWLCRRFHWKMLGAWYFGTDIADMIRMIMVESEKNGNQEISGYFKEEVAQILDRL